MSSDDIETEFKTSAKFYLTNPQNPNITFTCIKEPYNMYTQFEDELPNPEYIFPEGDQKYVYFFIAERQVPYTGEVERVSSKCYGDKHAHEVEKSMLEQGWIPKDPIKITIERGKMIDQTST